MLERKTNVAKASMTDVLTSHCYWKQAKHLWNGLQSLTTNWKLSWSSIRRYVIMSKTGE